MAKPPYNFTGGWVCHRSLHFYNDIFHHCFLPYHAGFCNDILNHFCFFQIYYSHSVIYIYLFTTVFVCTTHFHYNVFLQFEKHFFDNGVLQCLFYSDFLNVLFYNVIFHNSLFQCVSHNSVFTMPCLQCLVLHFFAMS